MREGMLTREQINNLRFERTNFRHNIGKLARVWSHKELRETGTFDESPTSSPRFADIWMVER